jgi:hypothetical protein
MKVRNRNENLNYIKHLKAAIDQIEQAVDSVTYVVYPELNQRLIAKLNEAADLLKACAHTGIFKP